MSPEIHNLYPYLSHKERDEILTLFEGKQSVDTLRRAIAHIKGFAVSEQAILESLVISYLDEGDSQRAESLAREFLYKSPNAHTHNLILRCMLSSTRNIQQEFYEESRNWAKLYETETTRSPSPSDNRDRDTAGKLSIGLFCNYANTVFGEMAIFPMLQNFAEAGIDVFLYNFSLSELHLDGVHLKNCDQGNIFIHNVKNSTLEQLKQKVLDDQIEILFDLNGRLREDNRLDVFFHRPAPVQINYFNLTGTSGMKSFDYVIADTVTLPQEDEKFYTERVIRLPCDVNGAYQMLRTTAIGSLPYQKKGYITFASFNAFFKINDPLLNLWGRILREVPESRIIIKNQEVSRQRVRKKIYAAFSAHGIAKDRVILEGYTPMEIMKVRYAAVDIALDTFPYSGGSTTLNALWQGVPVIALQGRGWRCNTAASMLTSAGLEGLIVHSTEEYLQKAVHLATDTDLLQAVREHIKTNIQNCPYFRPDIVYPQIAAELQKVRPGKKTSPA